jgi:hypothetical protein
VVDADTEVVTDLHGLFRCWLIASAIGAVAGTVLAIVIGWVMTSSLWVRDSPQEEKCFSLCSLY